PGSTVRPSPSPSHIKPTPPVACATAGTRGRCSSAEPVRRTLLNNHYEMPTTRWRSSLCNGGVGWKERATRGDHMRTTGTASTLIRSTTTAAIVVTLAACGSVLGVAARANAQGYGLYDGRRRPRRFLVHVRAPERPRRPIRRAAEQRRLSLLRKPD